MNLLKLANPVTVTKGAFGLAGAAVGLMDTVARDTAQGVLSRLHQPDGHDGGDEVGRQPSRPDRATGSDVTEVEGAPPGPTVVPVEPHAPEEPPIDVVGQALAHEAALDDGVSANVAGMAHEPRGASRDEEHGEARLQRAEVDELADEVTATLDGDVEPEEHLTEPVLDPADAKALAAEMRTMTRAADSDKG
jgi:hypothetical protein